MDPPLTLQTLKLDCLLEILKYVPLPRCMSLRSTCSQLKTAVDEHFRTGVKALPVMLSARHSPEHFARFNQYCERLAQDPKNLEYEKTTFGFGNSQLVLWDGYLFPVRESYFRFENCLILFDPAKFCAFIEFISKYLPNVIKLALLIDHDDHLVNTPEVLNIYQKQLKVLLVEKTLRSTLKLHEDLGDDFDRNVTKFELPEEVYNSLDNLNALESLYFFPKSIGVLLLADEHQNPAPNSPPPESAQCLDRLARRLRVLQHTCDIDHSPFGYFSEVYETLEELACFTPMCLLKSNANFPRLARLICYYDNFLWLELFNKVPNLSEFWSNFYLSISRREIIELDNFPNLKRIRCKYVSLGYPQNPELLILLGLYDEQRDGVPGSNQTIQKIEVEHLHDPEGSNLSDEEALEKLKHCLSFFRNLEKVIVRHPYMELTGEQLRSG